MVSVIIPLMPIVPYTEQIGECLNTLSKQTEKIEVFIVEQPVEKYINKNKLLNQGFKKSKGEFILHCDADFRFNDVTMLERMVNKMKSEKLDCLYPMFQSRVYKRPKIADGGPMFTQEALMKMYPLNENFKGISWVTFPLLNYAVKNLRFHCSTEFMIDIDQQRGGVGRRHNKTGAMLRPIFKETVKILKGKGAWPA